MRVEVFYGLVLFVTSCSFLLLSLPLFLKLSRRAVISVPRFRLTGIPLVLSVVLSLLVASILFPSIITLIDMPLEILAGGIMVFLLGIACDIGNLNGRHRLLVLLFSSLALPLSGIVVEGTLGVIFTICFVVTLCMEMNIVEKHSGFGTALLLMLQAVCLMLCWKKGAWNSFFTTTSLCGALLGFLGLKRYYFLVVKKKMILSDSGIYTSAYLTAISCIQVAG